MLRGRSSAANRIRRSVFALRSTNARVVIISLTKRPPPCPGQRVTHRLPAQPPKGGVGDARHRGEDDRRVGDDPRAQDERRGATGEGGGQLSPQIFGEPSSVMSEKVMALVPACDDVRSLTSRLYLMSIPATVTSELTNVDLVTVTVKSPPVPWIAVRHFVSFEAQINVAASSSFWALTSTM